jgi:hypothetical protein
MKHVTVMWMGSNKFLSEFQMNFEHENAAYILQQRVAQAMQCKTTAAVRIVYGSKDLAPYPETVCEEEQQRNESKLVQTWQLLIVELSLLKSLTLHASRFSQVSMWTHNLHAKPMYVAPKKAYTNRKFVLAACLFNGYNLQYASLDFQADRELVLVACRRSGCALQFASEQLQADYHVVLVACKQFGWALQYASSDLKANYDVVLAACTNCGSALMFASEEMTDNRSIAVAACANDTAAFTLLSTNLRADREIVLAVCKKHGLMLQHASPELRNDLAVIRVACQQNSLAIIYASKSAQQLFKSAHSNLDKQQGV